MLEQVLYGYWNKSYMGSWLRKTTGSQMLHSGMAAARLTHFVHEIDFRKIFECAHLNLWYMTARSYTHTPAQCSPASVGLALARPNYINNWQLHAFQSFPTSLS